MKPKVTLQNGAEWIVVPVATTAAASTARRRGARRDAAADVSDLPGLPPEFLDYRKVEITEDFVATPTPAVATGARRSATGLPALDLSVETSLDQPCVVVARHASGALTFHPPEPDYSLPRRGRAAASSAGMALRFRVPVRLAAPAAAARRGVISKAIAGAVRIFVVKVVDKLVNLALPHLAAAWEKRAWHSLTEDWLRVSVTPTGEFTVRSWEPDAATLGDGPRLLFIHGTFSDAAGGFGKLAGMGFFSREEIVRRYGDRIFAFNHFSVSVTPQENAQRLVDLLPEGEWDFDVVTHSRGGLVLRHLVERADILGDAGRRFRAGRVVLVASPNEGTPLATPDRWEKTLGWFANLMEVFPDNPWTTGAGWVAESLVWLARHAAEGLPGIGSMNGRGETIAALQEPPAPPAGAYSALVANFKPEGALWQRLADVGMDGFFGTANDLVVPTEGGWRVDKDGDAYVPAERIGCFGTDGNLLPDQPGQVTHVSFFARPETTEFLANALLGRPHDLPLVDLARPLARRGIGADSAAAAAASSRSLASRTKATVSASAPALAGAGARRTSPILPHGSHGRPE